MATAEGGRKRMPVFETELLLPCPLEEVFAFFSRPANWIEVAPPLDDDGSVEARKAQIRAAHLIERDAQLCQPSVRRFVREMERRRLHKGEWRSIFTLMRDGRELGGSSRRSIHDL